MRPIKKGSTDQSVVVRIIDSGDGTPETGVLYNTSGIDMWYRREGGLEVSITEATLSALNDAHADGGFLHISDGYYRVDLPDAAVATGANGVLVGGAVTGMIVIACYVPLVDYDPYDPAMGLGPVRANTATAGGASTITLDASASATDNTYDGMLLAIVGGTGEGQAKRISSYVGSTKVATMQGAWTVQPDNTSQFVIIRL